MLLLRIQVEETLLENEKRFSFAQSFAQAGLWEYNINTGDLYWSKECEELFGLSEGEFEGTYEAFMELIHPEDRTYVADINQPIVKQKEGLYLDYEHRIIRKNGEIRWINEKAGLAEGKDGNLSGIIGLATDITERKHTEEALMESEKRYRGLIESQNDLIVRVDIENRFTYVNDTYCNLFGKTREELLGNTFTPLIHEDDVEETLKVMEGLYKPPYRIQVTQRAMAADGWRWIQWEDNAVLGEDGEIVEIQGVGRDITSLQKALEENEAILNSFPDCMLRLSHHGTIKDYHVMEPSLFFLSEGDLNNKQIFDVMPKSIAERISGGIKEACHQKKSISFEYEYSTGEAARYFHAKAIKCENGDILFIIREFSDVKEKQKTLERITLEAKRAKDNLNFVLNVVNDAIWSQSVNPHSVIFMNRAFEDIYENKLECFYEKPDYWKEFVHPRDIDIINKAYDDLEKFGETANEYRIVFPGGRIKWLYDRVWAQKDDQGRIIRLDGIITDITDRKEVEKALSTKESLLWATVAATEGFLKKANYYDAIAEGFSFLGKALEVDRIYYFENDYGNSAEKALTSQKVEWVALGIEPQIDNCELQNLPIQNMMDFFDPLLKGEHFLAKVEKLEEGNLKTILKNQGILSLVAFPVEIRGQLWGFVGFDECKYDRDWTETEYQLLKAFSISVARAVERSIIEKELRSAIKSSKQANEEKDVLLKETHHRVKNNLQLIASLLYLQYNKSGDPHLIRMMVDSENRIKAMSLVHEIIYQSENIARVNSNAYIKRLIKYLSQTYNTASLSISIKLQLEEVYFSLEKGIIVGLIINELFTNAVKYAFREGAGGEIYVKIEDLDKKYIRIVIADNGIGIPCDILISKKKTLGLELVQNLVKQAKGSLKVDNTKGTTYLIDLPAETNQAKP